MPGNEGVADGGVAADGAGGGGENNLSVGSVGVGSHWGDWATLLLVNTENSLKKVFNRLK